MTGNWFHRLSPSGRHVAAGNVDLRVWLDERPVTEPPSFEVPGLMRPVWLDDDTIIANAHNGSGIYRVPVRHPGAAERIDPRGANRLTAGKGWWAGWRPDIGIYVSDGTIISNGRLPAIDGPSLAYVRDRADGTQQLMLDQTVIWEGAVLDVWLRDGVLLWRTGANRLLRWTLAAGIEDVTLDPARGEFWGVPLDGYILSHDDQRLMLRRGRETHGWVVHKGVTDEPDVRPLDHRHCRIVWSANGVAAERTIDLDSPMEDLRWGPPEVLPPLPTDLWEWMSPTQDGLIVADAGGQTLQTWQTADGVLDQVKWGNPRALERWTRHDTEVRLAYDATDPKGVESPWRLYPNRWARRYVEPDRQGHHLTAGTASLAGVVDIYPDAVLIRRQRGTTTREPFPFAVGQLAFIPAVDLGGDLGWCAVRKLTFSPWYPTSGETEINWYAIRLSDGVRFGRVRFQLVKDGRTVVDALLNRVLPGPGVRPAAPLPIPDPPEVIMPVRAIIIEPSTWPQTVQVNQPLRCVATVTQGEAHRFVWQWRGARWMDAAVNDARDDDHTFRFTEPGPRQIRLKTLGVDGSEDVSGPRDVIVVLSPPNGGPSYDKWVRPGSLDGEYTDIRGAVLARWGENGSAMVAEKAAHYTWQRLRENRRLDAILREIRGEVVPPVEPPPVNPPEPPTDLEAVWPVSRVRQVRTNFLALAPWGYIFMLPGYEVDEQVKILQALRREGHTHVPFGIWGRYPGLPSFDYRNDPSGFRMVLDRCYAHDICPIVFLHTDRMADNAPKWHEGDIAAFWADYLPRIADRIRAAALGWEWDQIDGEAVISGHTQLRLIAEARRHLTPSTTLYGHWGPERWAGGPDRALDYTRDEYAWWTDARHAGMTGCLYNDNNAGLDAALDRLLRLPSPHGASPGIAGRLAYLGVDCVAFELSRGDYARWQAVRRAVEGHRDVQGWG